MAGNGGAASASGTLERDGVLYEIMMVEGDDGFEEVLVPLGEVVSALGVQPI